MVVRSTSRPDMLSIRVHAEDRSATPFNRALTESGAKPGDVVELRACRKLGSQCIDVEDRFDEEKLGAAKEAMATPLAKAAWEALRAVAEQHGIEACDEDECYFPRCLGDGCEAEPKERP